MSISRKRRRELNPVSQADEIRANPQLVNEVFQVIAQHAPFRLFANAARVSRRFNTLFSGPHFWKKIIRHHFPFICIEDNQIDNTQDWSKLFKSYEYSAYRYFHFYEQIDQDNSALAFFYAKEGDLRNFKKVFKREFLHVRDNGI